MDSYLHEIVDSVSKVTDLVGEIAEASNEQTQGISQVNQGLGQIDQVTQQNTASAEQSAAAAEELSGQVGQLQGMLRRFKLKNAAHINSSISSLPPNNSFDASGWDGLEAEAMPTAEAGQPGAPQNVIALDDEEFGRY